MRARIALALSAVLCTAPLAAHADILATYGLSNAFPSPTSGTFVVDNTTDQLFSVDITMDGAPLTSFSDAGASDGGFSVSISGAAGTGLLTLFPANGSDDPAGFSNGSFRLLGPVGYSNGDFAFVSSTDNSITPEPASLFLLATGLLALPFARKQLQSHPGTTLQS